ncbi:hypothetical protein HDV02_006566 [Globomyces sp. JEL0801]|nr:hypothetical protein HDV02_006566 [Globomyces sp. JEL0801]
MSGIRKSYLLISSFSTAVKFNLIATVGALFTMTALYAITFEELRLQNQKLEPTAARQKGSRAMMRLIIAFTTANTCIWAPFIIFVAMSVMFSVKRDMGVIVLNASPGILVLAIIFQILFSSKGIVYGFSIWWYVKGVKKQNQRIAIPIQIFHEHMPVSESSNNTSESTTNPSQNYIPPSTIRQLSLMGVDIPDHLAVYSKAALNSSMQHFPDSPDHSLESSFMPYESYIIHEPALYQVPSPTCNSDGTATEDNSHCEYPLPAAK